MTGRWLALLAAGACAPTTAAPPPARLERAIFEADIDDEGTTRSGELIRLTTDMGHTLELEALYLSIFRVGLQRCPDEPLARSFVHSLLSPRVAQANHPDDDPSTFPRAFVVDALGPTSQLVGETSFPPNPYCSALLFIARDADGDALKPQGAPDFDRASVMVRGSRVLSDGQHIDFAASTSLSLMATLEDDAFAEIEGCARIRFRWQIGTLFDGLELDQMDERELGIALIRAAIETSELDISACDP